MGKPVYAYGVEWKSARGQVFIQLPDHEMSRTDGFYARAKLIFEEELAAGRVKVWDGQLPVEGKGPLVHFVHCGCQIPLEHFESLCGGWFHVDEVVVPRFLEAKERVYHMDGDPGSDDPSNLMLFHSQGAIAQFRSKLFHTTRDANYRDRMKGLTGVQKELRDRVGVVRASQMEKRAAAARKAHRERKAKAAQARRDAARAKKGGSG